MMQMKRDISVSLFSRVRRLQLETTKHTNERPIHKHIYMTYCKAFFDEIFFQSAQKLELMIAPTLN